MKYLFSLIVFSFLLTLQLAAQLSGKITDINGEALSFASIYVQGSSKGTTSNVDGFYQFNPGKGKHTLVFQYVGYRQEIVQIELSDASQKLDIQLRPEAIELNEVVVRANAEDPAYAIIRKAIAKRDYYKNLVDSYRCDVYIKGVQKLLDAPEKIFGQELGDLGGNLDSNRQGIIYLSESEAKLNYQRPGKYKEEMISSKVSGSDNGFSFNRATLMDFSFYNNHIDIERQILSPIADNALAYYRYHLVGSILDEEGRLINKIQVIPKRSEDPVFRGHIYIVEDLWNIHSTELILTGAAIKQPVLDTLIIKQLHVPVKSPDVWMQFSQSVEFTFAIFGFKARGNFTGIFSNYELGVDFKEGFFNNELFKVNEDANEKPPEYWSAVRPVPLTVEEVKDYVKKDSLQVIWKSKEFMDSMDHKSNKFKIWDLLFGYSYNNSYKKQFFSLGSPLTKVQFNTVQGFYGDLDITYRKEFDEYNMRYLLINPKLQYGLADKRLRGEMAFTYNFNRTNFRRISMSGGRMTQQFNSSDPITPTLNSLFSLLGKRNYLKIYEHDFGRLEYREELWNGGLFNGELEYADRRALQNNTDYSFFNKSDSTYTSNHPLIATSTDPSFNAHQALVVNLAFRLRFKQQYITYPGRKIIEGTKYPDFTVRYRKAIRVNSNFVDYDLLSMNIKDDYTFGLVGRMEWSLQGGMFLNDKRVEFPDYQHFNGNQTFIANPEDYLSSFLLLPYYEYSTKDKFAQAHFQHHFEGFLMDKLPALRKLGWKTVAGFSFLYTSENDPYFEVSFGIDNIGINIFRLFRVDVASAFRNGKYDQTGIVVGVKL